MRRLSRCRASTISGSASMSSSSSVRRCGHRRAARASRSGSGASGVATARWSSAMRPDLGPLSRSRSRRTSWVRFTSHGSPWTAVSAARCRSRTVSLAMFGGGSSGAVTLSCLAKCRQASVNDSVRSWRVGASARSVTSWSKSAMRWRVEDHHQPVVLAASSTRVRTGPCRSVSCSFRKMSFQVRRSASSISSSLPYSSSCSSSKRRRSLVLPAPAGACSSRDA